METICSTKGRTEKRVLIKGTEGHTREEIINHALKEAGETRSSLFNIRVSAPDITGHVLVRMDTD